MSAMRLEQVQRFILAKKYFGVMGTLIKGLPHLCHVKMLGIVAT